MPVHLHEREPSPPSSSFSSFKCLVIKSGTVRPVAATSRHVNVESAQAQKTGSPTASFVFIKHDALVHVPGVSAAMSYTGILQEILSGCICPSGRRRLRVRERERAGGKHGQCIEMAEASCYLSKVDLVEEQSFNP